MEVGQKSKRLALSVCVCVIIFIFLACNSFYFLEFLFNLLFIASNFFFTKYIFIYAPFDRIFCVSIERLKERIIQYSLSCIGWRCRWSGLDLDSKCNIFHVWGVWVECRHTWAAACHWNVCFEKQQEEEEERHEEVSFNNRLNLHI